VTLGQRLQPGALPGFPSFVHRRQGELLLQSSDLRGDPEALAQPFDKVLVERIDLTSQLLEAIDRHGGRRRSSRRQQTTPA
jgi:hypothetical protein